MLYWATIVFCALYKTSSITNINVHLGNLSLINAISLYATIYLNALINVLSMSLIAFRRLYDLVELIIDALIVTYVNITVNLKNNNSILLC